MRAVCSSSQQGLFSRSRSIFLSTPVGPPSAHPSHYSDYAANSTSDLNYDRCHHLRNEHAKLLIHRQLHQTPTGSAKDIGMSRRPQLSSKVASSGSPPDVEATTELQVSESQEGRLHGPEPSSIDRRAEEAAPQASLFIKLLFRTTKPVPTLNPYFPGRPFDAWAEGSVCRVLSRSCEVEAGMAVASKRRSGAPPRSRFTPSMDRPKRGAKHVGSEA